MAKAPLPFPKIKRHRKTGPALSLAGLLGFCIGFTLVMLDTGNVFEYPAHLAVGAVIVALLITTFVISRKIKGQDSPLRTPHMIIGIAILCCYLVEVFLGVGALF